MLPNKVFICRLVCRPILSRALCSSLLFIVGLNTIAVHGQNYSLTWFAVAGGGGTSAGGPYTLSGTVGQSCAAPVVTGGNFNLYGGFWSLFALPPDLPPILPGPQTWVIDVLATLMVTNTASSIRVPASGLSYQLLGAPVGAFINSNGVITWTPTGAEGGTTNTIVTTVTDNGSPPLSATNNFVVVVRNLFSGIDLSDPAVATTAPSGDGFSNLLKYALGIDPANTADDRNGLAVSTTQAAGTQYLRMTYRQRMNAPWLTYVPEVSSDGQTWFSDSAHVQQINTVPIDDQFDSVAVQDLTATTPTSPRFIRLRVISN